MGAAAALRHWATLQELPQWEALQDVVVDVVRAGLTKAAPSPYGRPRALMTPLYADVVDAFVCALVTLSNTARAAWRTAERTARACAPRYVIPFFRDCRGCVAAVTVLPVFVPTLFEGMVQEVDPDRDLQTAGDLDLFTSYRTDLAFAVAELAAPHPVAPPVGVLPAVDCLAALVRLLEQVVQVDNIVRSLAPVAAGRPSRAVSAETLETLVGTMVGVVPWDVSQDLLRHVIGQMDAPGSLAFDVVQGALARSWTHPVDLEDDMAVLRLLWDLKLEGAEPVLQPRNFVFLVARVAGAWEALVHKLKTAGTGAVPEMDLQALVDMALLAFRDRDTIVWARTGAPTRPSTLWALEALCWALGWVGRPFPTALWGWVPEVHREVVADWIVTRGVFPTPKVCCRAQSLCVSVSVSDRGWFWVRLGVSRCRSRAPRPTLCGRCSWRPRARP